MTTHQPAETTHTGAKGLRSAKPMDWFLLALVLTFIAVFNSVAMQDRLLLILYAMGVAGATFTLLKRSAYVLTAVALAGASTALLVNVYFQTAAESWHPTLDVVRDVGGLSLLAFGSAMIIREAFRVQKETRDAEMQAIFEKNLISMRAAALRSASHEVRTPLSTIIAVNETLMNGSTGPLTDIQQDFLQDIDNASHHLMDLVNDILDYAKGESGMITIVPELVAMEELAGQCATMVKPKATEAGVTVTVQVSPEVNEIVADPLRIKQILLNLLSNAIKYTGLDGTVSLRVRSDGEHVRISVRDTGRGIAPEHLPHLFNPYYQAAREDQSIGTGLGLAIMKHLTELHGGTVTVESVVGTGTVFTVSLPRKASIKSESDAAPLESQSSESSGDGAEKGDVLLEV